MHRSIRTLFFIFLLITVFSCGNKNESVTPTGYFVKYKAGGNDYFFDAANRTSSNFHVQYNIYYKLFSLSVDVKEGEEISLGGAILENYKPQTTEIVADCTHNDQFYSASNASSQINGTCTITKSTTKELEGTFSFDVYSVKDNSKLSVTGGQFRVPL
jgi:hypothetical protein